MNRYELRDAAKERFAQAAEWARAHPTLAKCIATAAVAFAFGVYAGNAGSVTITLTPEQVQQVITQSATTSTQTPAATPTPAPTPSPAYVVSARFDSAPSDWARWQFWQSAEFAPLVAKLMATRGMSEASARLRISQQINIYLSTVKLAGKFDATRNLYCFIRADGWGTYPPTCTADVAGAADAYIAQTQPSAVAYGPLK